MVENLLSQLQEERVPTGVRNRKFEREDNLLEYRLDKLKLNRQIQPKLNQNDAILH